jgi:outer membrane protein TolC
MPRLRLSLLLALLLAAPASADPLDLSEILETTRRSAPVLLEAEAKRRAADARRLEADGAFDTSVDAMAETRLSGTYNGRYLESEIRQPFSNRGGYAYGGYRLSDGTFPIYEDERFTNQLGEVRLGAIFALWRDRAIDERRLARNLADAGIELAETEALIAAVGLQRRALEAHALWVAAGLRLAAFRELLAVASERQAGIERQVREGAVPAILATENRQAILRRQSLVADAERALAVAAARLSVFYRSPAGEPQMPPASRLPAHIELVPIAQLPPDGALPARPDVAAVDNRIAQARQRLAQDRNLLQPRLDLKVEASQDIGEIAEGGPSRSGTETKVGLNFSVPLQRRAAQGKIAQTEAAVAALEAERKRIAEEIGVQLSAVSTDVRATARLLSLARDDATQAEALARAERRRLDLGTSDLLRVALREEGAADARVREIDAALRQALAHAELAAATADLRLLGL